MKSLGLLLFVVYKFSYCGMELIFGASLKTTQKKKKKEIESEYYMCSFGQLITIQQPKNPKQTRHQEPLIT